MVGKKGTLRAARSLLYRHGVRAVRTTELAQVGAWPRGRGQLALPAGPAQLGVPRHSQGQPALPAGLAAGWQHPGGGTDAVLCQQPCMRLRLQAKVHPIRGPGVDDAAAPAAQGKTSRWALAWSFTADANAASQPLPRFPNNGAAGGAAAPGQAQQRQPSAGAAAAAPGRRPVGRKLSWQVQAPARAGGAVLAAIRQCMQQATWGCLRSQQLQDQHQPYTFRPARIGRRICCGAWCW